MRGRHAHATAKLPTPVRSLTESLQHRARRVTPATFAEVALEVFAHQRRLNPTYREWLRLSGQLDATPTDWQAIPCVPISLFRTHDVRTGNWEAEAQFRSSGTTGSQSSYHPIRDVQAYRAGCRRTFERLVSPLYGLRVLALLPNYLQQGQSGLVDMIRAFVAHAHEGSGFYLDDLDALRMRFAEPNSPPLLLWGVTFALLDLVEAHGPQVLPKGSILVETGGMKGRRKELTRDELHGRLRTGYLVRGDDDSIGPVRILSEYGMTEMQSQGYLLDRLGRFTPAAGLRVRAREVTDPRQLLGPGRAGVLNVYDLANVDTLSFIQTDDLGRVYADERFEVLGRLDHSIVRGCSQLTT